jgi:hypothetical protein
MTIDEATEGLSQPICDLLTLILAGEDPQCLAAWQAMLDDKLDLRVVCELRAGSISLQAFNAAGSRTLWSKTVPPLREAGEITLQ